MDEMLDALLSTDMIEKVTEISEFLFEAFLVPKPKDTTGLQDWWLTTPP